MLDALVSGSVALFVSQMLLPPSPVSLLKDAGREALGSIAEGLCVSARALSDGDATAAGTSLEYLREEGWGSMASLVAARKTSGKVACRTLRGRREAGRFERLETRLGEIHLLFEGGLLLTRASRRLLDGHVAAPRWLVPTIHELAREVMALAEDPESSTARRQARDSALGVAQQAASGEGPGAVDPCVALVAEEVHLVASGLLQVAAPEGAGLEPAD